MRILLPFPFINGCATFISTYLAIISSREFSGICSIFTNASFRYKLFANLNPPFEIFFCRICPAKSYNPPNKYL